jgi:translation elongation factor EF-G
MHSNSRDEIKEVRAGDIAGCSRSKASHHRRYTV